METNLIGEMHKMRPPLPLGLVLISLFMLLSAAFGTALYCLIALVASLFGGYPTWNGALSFAVLFAFGFPSLSAMVLANSEEP